MNGNTDSPDGVRIITDKARAQLNKRQMVDYTAHRKALVKWMIHKGKEPDEGEGYAHETVKRRANNLDMIYRWVWGEFDGYTADITHDHADAFNDHLAFWDDISVSYKSNLQKALKMLFTWREEKFGDEMWEPEITFNASVSATAPRDYFTKAERRKLRESALRAGSIPHYNSVTPKERSELKQYLAMRFKKPIDDIGPKDFKRANGFKIPSLVWASLDAGLRPLEVARAKPSWIDTENAVLRIPARDSTKNDQNWTVAIQRKTAEMLAEWKAERQQYEKYEGSDNLWLTRENNPYRSSALKHVLNKLVEDASINPKDRSLSWYAIRHSVGTYMSREDGLAAAQTQLRHISEKTTMKYDQAPVEDRQDALSRMG